MAVGDRPVTEFKTITITTIRLRVCHVYSVHGGRSKPLRLTLRWTIEGPAWTIEGPCAASTGRQCCPARQIAAQPLSEYGTSSPRRAHSLPRPFRGEHGAKIDDMGLTWAQNKVLRIMRWESKLCPPLTHIMKSMTPFRGIARSLGQSARAQATHGCACFKIQATSLPGKYDK